MEIIRHCIDTRPGPENGFTGDVFIDMVATPSDASQVLACFVHFTPGARTCWHTHPHGQTITITAGSGRCQRRGGPVEEIHAGDVVHFAPGEDHWHGAAPNRFMTQFGVHQVDDPGAPSVKGDQVTDEEYEAAPSPHHDS